MSQVGIAKEMPGWKTLSKYPKLWPWLIHFSGKRTPQGYGYVIHRWMEDMKIDNPDLLLDDPTKTKLLLRQWVSRRPSTKLLLSKAIVSFFAYYEITLLFRRGEFTYGSIKAQDQHIPSNSEIYRIASACGGTRESRLRDRAIIITLFNTGCRVNAISRLTWGMDSPNEEWGNFYDQLQSGKYPIVLKITKVHDTKMSKVGIGWYPVFIGKEGRDAIRAYRKYLENIGANVSDDAPVFQTDHNSVRRVYEHVTYMDIYTMFKRGIRNAGLDPSKIWIHTLRKAFDKVLVKADVDPDLREGMMGHRIPGIRGNYWDYHDVNPAYDAFRKSDFSPSGTVRLDDMERIVLEQKEKIKELEEKLTIRTVRTEPSSKLAEKLEDLEDLLSSKKGRKILEKALKDYQ